MSSSESDEDIGGFCKHCSKNCDSLHTFLRHVSHSKSCKAAYDQEFLDKMKKKAKVMSKRKFYKNLSKSEKKQRYEQEKDRRCANAKKRYVPKWKFTTIEGRAFENEFKLMFDMASKETETKLHEMSKKVEYLDVISFDKAMDYIFDQGLEELIKSDNDCTGEGDIEAIFDEMFEKKLKESKIHEQQCWSAQGLAEVLDRLYFSTLNKAYLEYFNEDFKTLFMDAEETSMDKVFFDIESIEMKDVPEEQNGSFEYFLELAISNAVHATHKTEFHKMCEESGLTTRILDLIRKQFAVKMKRNKLVQEYI